MPHVKQVVDLPGLEIRLLGGFTLTSDGLPIHALRLPRQRELITWILLHPGESQSRGRMAALFWPDAGEAQGRNNLRKVVHELRAAWPEVDGWLQSDRSTITWLTARPYHLDVDHFLRLARTEGEEENLQAAASAYTGDLLPDCYEEWILLVVDDLQWCDNVIGCLNDSAGRLDPPAERRQPPRVIRRNLHP